MEKFKTILFYVSIAIFSLSSVIILSFGYITIKEIQSNDVKVKEISKIDLEIKNKIAEMKKLNIENEKLKIELEDKLKDIKTVYLTFDDGPSTGNTLKILEILKKNNIKATFFVIGQNKELYKKIVEEGHTIAIHTYTHKYSQIYASVDAFFADLYKLQESIKKETNIDSKVTRFPGGSSNTITSKQMKREIINRLNEEGFVYQDWNCDSTDASGSNVPIDTLVYNATVKCPYKKVNILMHDSQAKVTTVEALQKIIDYYKSKDYMFEKLETYSPKFQHMK